MNWSTTRTQSGILLLALGLATSACTSWHPVTNPVAEVASRPPASHYLVTTVVGAEIPLTRLQYRSDSLVGIWDEKREERSFGLPTSSVKSIAVRKFSIAKTTILVLPVALLTAFVVDALGNSSPISGSFGR